MTTLPLGTVRYSIGIEGKNNMVGSMSDPHHTPCTIRQYIKNLQKGTRLRVIKFTLVKESFFGEGERVHWHANLNTDKKGLRVIIV